MKNAVLAFTISIAAIHPSFAAPYEPRCPQDFAIVAVQGIPRLDPSDPEGRLSFLGGGDTASVWRVNPGPDAPIKQVHVRKVYKEGYDKVTAMDKVVLDLLQKTSRPGDRVRSVKVIGTPKPYILLLEDVQGRSLASVWSSLSPKQKQAFWDDYRVYITNLIRRIPAQAPIIKVEARGEGQDRFYPVKAGSMPRQFLKSLPPKDLPMVEITIDLPNGSTIPTRLFFKPDNFIATPDNRLVLVDPA